MVVELLVVVIVVAPVEEVVVPIIKQVELALVDKGMQVVITMDKMVLIIQQVVVVVQEQ